MATRCPNRVTGIDFAPEVVAAHQAKGRDVIRASATDPDFWNRLQPDHRQLRLVMLALPVRDENTYAAMQLVKNGYQGTIAALAKFHDDVSILKAAGVHRVFNLYAEAGGGFAEDAWQEIDKASPAD
ncbi:MAG: NAD-binding protein [Pseudomonadota bacterium]